MEFLLDIKVMLLSEDYMAYLNLLIWPKLFREWVYRKKLDLQSAKDNLFYEMGSEKDMIFEKIQDFKLHIKRIQNEGLINTSLITELITLTSEEEEFSPTSRKRRDIAK
jgi:hypothetical protein